MKNGHKSLLASMIIMAFVGGMTLIVLLELRQTNLRGALILLLACLVAAFFVILNLYVNPRYNLRVPREFKELPKGQTFMIIHMVEGKKGTAIIQFTNKNAGEIYPVTSGLFAGKTAGTHWSVGIDKDGDLCLVEASNIHLNQKIRDEDLSPEVIG